MHAALHVYNERIAVVEEGLLAQIAAAKRSDPAMQPILDKLPKHSASTNLAMTAMTDEAELIFSDFQSDQPGKAARRTTEQFGATRGRAEVVIVERRRAEEALRELTLTDDLTGLYNQRGFFTVPTMP